MMDLREGFWILGVFFPFIQSPHVLVENEQIVPVVLSAVLVELQAFDPTFHPPLFSSGRILIDSYFLTFCLFMRLYCSSVYVSVALESRKTWAEEVGEPCRLKVLVFKWQGALFPLTLSQINWASQVCL